MRVIIVEDEIRIREGVKKLLVRLDSEIEVVGEAENGEEGLRLLRENEPDIVITDIRMPRIDGLEMLTQMTEEGIKSKAIVLSAYSEFDYARQAMKLGITEYLLKPISFNDFSLALQNIKLQVDKAKQTKPAQIGTIEQIFHAMISGQIEINQGVLSYLYNNYKITKEQPFALICAYLGEEYETSWNLNRAYFQQAFSLYAGLSYVLVDSIYRNSLIIVIYHYDNPGDIERWVQYQILKHAPEKIAAGWIEVNGVDNIQSGLATLLPYMDWNISFDKEILISYPKITNVQTSSCIYPINIETRAKSAVCSSDLDALETIMHEFHFSFQDGKIYQPKEIKELYVRFIWSLISLAKEMCCIQYEHLDQQKLLSQIMNAKMRDELIEAANVLLKSMKSTENTECSTHLTVRRMRSLVQEFYRTGITLDEISIKLNMTPEYLGTLFHKEIGMTFSSYIKNCRINKAKELLCSTQLKLYEISDRVGYSDPKYFSKVFREITGQLPNDYRRSYR